MSNTAKLESTHQTTCCYCGVGCGVVAKANPADVIAVSGDQQHPANYGRLCVKGSSLHETHQSKDRLLTPLLHGKPVSWEESMAWSASRFRAILDQHGPESVAFYLSGQLLTEDYYVANKLMKGFIGSANVDTNSRLCMASATVAHKRAFGADAMPGCYEDLEATDCLIITGANMAYAHPVLFQRISHAKSQRPEMKIVVIDPRRTATCEIADVHLPLKAGTDGFLFNGLLSYLAEQNAVDHRFIADHCENFDAALSAAQAQCPDLASTARQCDLPLEPLRQVFDWFTQSERCITVFSQGVNQSSSGVDKGNAIINCHLASAKIGKPGSAPFSITGQPNAMGGREVGGLANQLAAHMSFDSQEDIDRVARFWKTDNIARQEGRKAVDMFNDIDSGKIKAVWVMATNPAVTMPQADFIRQALQKCELVMVSECIANTDTAQLADVVFPTSTWAEKHGTVTNSERCISLQKGFIPPPGQARHDWQIMVDFAARIGFGDAFNYSHPVEIFREHAQLSAFENASTGATNSKHPTSLRGFNIAAYQNISLHEYENLQPTQWPITEASPNGTQRLFTDGLFYTPSRKARFQAIQARLPLHAASNKQLILNTGRIRDQWHTMSRTGNAAKLLGHIDEPFIDIHPADAKQCGLTEGMLAKLSNEKARGGDDEAPCYFGRICFNEGQRRGEIFAPMHWNQRFASRSRVDALVNEVTDPLSGQPEFKQTPVNISAYDAHWYGLLHCASDQFDAALPAQYWCKIPLAEGDKYRFADRDQEHDWPTWLKAQFPQIDDWMEMDDSANAFYSACGFIEDKLIVSFRIATEQQNVVEQRWLEEQLGRSCDLQACFAVLAGFAGDGAADEGKMICSCFQVGENRILEAIEQGCTSAQALGEQLRCGTNCGSCIPELNSLVRAACKQSAA